MLVLYLFFHPSTLKFMNAFLRTFVVLLITLIGFGLKPSMAATLGSGVETYDERLPTIKLSLEDRVALKKGGQITKYFRMGKDGIDRKLSIMDVPGSTKEVMAIIRNFPLYTKYIPEVKEAVPYNDRGNTVGSRFALAKLGYQATYHNMHHFSASGLEMTFKLDESQKNEMDYVVGFWKLEPLGENSQKTRITYSITMKTSTWVPGFIRNMLRDKAVKNGPQWVKKAIKDRHSPK